MKLFKKPKSKFYWYDFTVRGRRYRASAQETKSVRALNIASLKLASVIQNTDPPPSKPVALGDFAGRFSGSGGHRQGYRNDRVEARNQRTSSAPNPETPKIDDLTRIWLSTGRVRGIAVLECQSSLSPLLTVCLSGPW